MPDQDDAARLKSELAGLFHYIQRVKEEVAAIDQPADAEHPFESMSAQLSAIVEATEHATHAILDAAEKSDAAVDALRAELAGNAKAEALLDRIGKSSANIYEACAFQDITGQRINKITKSLGYVEARVRSIAAIWDEKAMHGINRKDNQKPEDEKLLNGPQREGKGLSQADIDALFD